MFDDLSTQQPYQTLQLIQTLKAQKGVGQKKLEAALDAYPHTLPLHRYLLEQAVITPEKLATLIADQLVVPCANIDPKNLPLALITSVPRGYVISHHCLPYEETDTHIIVLSSGPLDELNEEMLHKRFGKPVVWHYALDSVIEALYERACGSLSEEMHG